MSNGRELCGRCQGPRPDATATVNAAGVTSKAAIIALRDRQIRDDAQFVTGSTAEELQDRPTPELVGTLTGKARESVLAQARVFAQPDPTSPASLAAQDQATAARREASRYEDAIRHRHPDPYGAAVATAAWDQAGENTGPEAQIRGWLAKTPQAPATDIHRALNTLAEHQVGVEKLAEMPWVNDLNRYAAVRASAMNNPGSVTEPEYRDAETRWQAVNPMVNR